MQKQTTLTLSIVCLSTLFIGIYFWYAPSLTTTIDPAIAQSTAPVKIKKMPRAERKKARGEYFHQLLRDPKTNQIPANIRANELAYARKLAQSTPAQLKSENGSDLAWREVGPNNVGGRTRALAVDIRNSAIVLAGGVDGGMWKSKDGGTSWELTSRQDQNASVTSVAQDPNEPDTWYFTTGEFDSSTFNDSETGEKLAGATGIFKSTNNGDSWNFIPINFSNTPINEQFPNANFLDGHHPFSFTSKIVISPTNSYIYIATSAYGIFRSTNKGVSFWRILGYGYNERFNNYNDIVVDQAGRLISAIGGEFFSAQENESNNNNNNLSHHTVGAGIYVSTDNGDTWSANIATGTLLDDNTESREVINRTVLAVAPSSPNIVYAFTQINEQFNNRHFPIRLSKFNFSDPNNFYQDYSENLHDSITAQDGYNMTLAVHPEDPDHLIIGGTDLFRSTDGMTSKLSYRKENFIGGTAGSDHLGEYLNHFPDQHALFFDPNNPDVLWSGNDGGVYKTNDIRADSIAWQDHNNGYNVMQFYTTSAILEKTIDTTFLMAMGGLQDNGSHYVRADLNDLMMKKQATSAEGDISGSDGGFCFLYNLNHMIFSTINGNIYLKKNKYFKITPDYDYLNIKAAFIQPFIVDCKDISMGYMPTEEGILVNKAMDQGPVMGVDTDGNNISNSSWTWLYQSFDYFSTVAISTKPADILYAATYSQDSAPFLIRIDNVSNFLESEDDDIEYNIDGIEEGSWINEIALNPNDANELILVVSNYNAPSVFYSNNGGENFTIVDGNLKNDFHGPSVRDAEIVTLNGEKHFFLATTTGIYSTNKLDGDNTVWVQEGAAALGNATVSRFAFDQITTEDGKEASVLVAATHGRGLFAGLKTASAEPTATIAAEFNRSCNQPSEGQAVIHVLLTAGTPPYQISGTYREENVQDNFFQFTITDGEDFLLDITDATGSSVALNGSNLLPCTKLAVDLLNFSGEVLATGNALTWTTAAEVDHDYFTLEHSTNGTDFTAIHQFDGQGNRSTATPYDYLHKIHTTGLHYYRLSATDLNGRVENLQTIALTRGEATGVVISQVYPNPVQDQVYVTLTQETAEMLVQAQLLGINGQVLKTFPPQTVAGNTLSFDVADLPKGIYHLALHTSDGQQQTVKIVK